MRYLFGPDDGLKLDKVAYIPPFNFNYSLVGKKFAARGIIEM
jgi:hypothetical protein